MKPATALVTILATSAHLAAAWPRWLPEIDALVVRQDSSEESSESSPTPTPTPTSGRGNRNEDEDEESSASGTPSPTTPADRNTAKVPTGTGTGTESTTSSKRIPADAAVGGIVMITPAVTDPGPNLYKIGDNVTFGWNYTELLATPSAVDVWASCSEVSRTWTLTQNMTWETVGSFVWDTEAQATNVQSPLLTEQYTLVIFEADTEITDTPRAGHLGVFDSFKFGMYVRQDYTDSMNVCPGCSAAAPSFGARGLGLALSISVATVLGFSLLH